MQALRLLRVFLNLNVYSSFERHTDSTLAQIDIYLKEFFAEVEVRAPFNLLSQD
jgi:hypothetical protein